MPPTSWPVSSTPKYLPLPGLCLPLPDLYLPLPDSHPTSWYMLSSFWLYLPLLISISHFLICISHFLTCVSHFWPISPTSHKYLPLLISISHFVVYISHFLTHVLLPDKYLPLRDPSFPFPHKCLTSWQTSHSCGWTSDKPQWLRGNTAQDRQLSLTPSDLWTLVIALHSFWSHSYIFKKYMWFQTLPYFPRIKQPPQSIPKQVSWECSPGFSSWGIILAKQKQF